MTLNVLILAGGKSLEHDISLISGRCVLEAMQHTALRAIPQVINRQGEWLSLQASLDALQTGKTTATGKHILYEAVLEQSIDVVFSLLHGPYGEDGTVQGLLAMAGLPVVGPGVLASALCMDKAMSKDLLKTYGIPQVPYCLVHSQDYQQNSKAILAQITQMTAPWFVKPANLGSSVGISKVHTSADLPKALEQALQYDKRVIVEQGVAGARELEVAILGNEKPQASPVGEITYKADFYDYETKYTPGHANLHIPTSAPQAIVEAIQTWARKAYIALDCAGMARVDFLYNDKTNEIWLNELNTIPGFTPLSMYPKLWEAAGLTYDQLIEKLVHLAINKGPHAAGTHKT